MNFNLKKMSETQNANVIYLRSISNESFCIPYTNTFTFKHVKKCLSNQIGVHPNYIKILDSSNESFLHHEHVYESSHFVFMVNLPIPCEQLTKCTSQDVFHGISSGYIYDQDDSNVIFLWSPDSIHTSNVSLFYLSEFHFNGLKWDFIQTRPLIKLHLCERSVVIKLSKEYVYIFGMYEKKIQKYHLSTLELVCELYDPTSEIAQAYISEDDPDHIYTLEKHNGVNEICMISSVDLTIQKTFRPTTITYCDIFSKMTVKDGVIALAITNNGCQSTFYLLSNFEEEHTYKTDNIHIIRGADFYIYKNTLVYHSTNTHEAIYFSISDFGIQQNPPTELERMSYDSYLSGKCVIRFYYGNHLCFYQTLQENTRLTENVMCVFLTKQRREIFVVRKENIEIMKLC